MKKIYHLAKQGLWKNNPALVQLLGLCPLLAVSSTVTYALGLGLATILVLVCTNLVISMIRHLIPNEVRIPIYIIIIAAIVSSVDMLMRAYLPALYQTLGIFIPLITTNCIVIGRAEAFAAKNPIHYAIFDGLMMGIGVLLALLTLGAVRELLSKGTLFDSAHLLFGPWATCLKIEIIHFDNPFLLAMLPPGAFIGLGLLLALKHTIDRS